MLRVLGRVTSINVRKVLWALDELGLTYDREDWGLPLRDPNVPEFLALNPNAQVPVLIDRGFSMWESGAILIYLADRDGTGALLSNSLPARGRALQWLGWQATELNAPWGYAVNALMRRNPAYSDQDRIAQSIAGWTAKMAILEAELGKGSPFIAGSDFSIADIALGLSCHRWFMTPFDKPSMPNVEAYYRRLGERDAGARWMPQDYG
ncbi:glutathione S-transferase family protein [Devosia sediminis]|uniref:Glutathione S-transferase family protein n=1 Tax=Devosia sediminis TaxID=2798801 RepID=A0A934J184_9HYPH|nr:glutathione S-transferase family protein [Devosia sediminis]MBJ3786955.1 glutathione S-transferase family protein [Devosia sediminis]